MYVSVAFSPPLLLILSFSAIKVSLLFLSDFIAVSVNAYYNFSDMYMLYIFVYIKFSQVKKEAILMKSNCTLYIDEGGDLGIGKGCDWSILSGVFIDKQEEPQIRETIKNIRIKLNINEIHFRKMASFDKKSYAVSELSKCHFEYIAIIADTNKINLSKLYAEYSEKPSILSYNHICRYLLERASWLLRDSNRVADIVLSSRGTSRDADLIAYIKNKLIPFNDNQIENCFGTITAKPASSWDMLQLADVCATSMYNMHQRNGLGFITPCYAYRLRAHLYRHNGKLLKYGMKYYDDAMQPSKQYFMENAVCYK